MRSLPLTAVVDIMVNPYGTLKVVLNRHQLTTPRVPARSNDVAHLCAASVHPDPAL